MNASLPAQLRLTRRKLLKVSLGAAGACLSAGSLYGQEPSALELAGNLTPVHDPCIIKANGLYHLVCTGQSPAELLPWRTSSDLRHWQLRGPAFTELPSWVRQRVPDAQGMWAPDISYWNGRYHLYYSCSTFGSNRSVIGLATATTLQSAERAPVWEDQGLVIASEPQDDFNAIDANHLVDRVGKHWLCLGSFWSGIKLFALDADSGKLAPNATKIALAQRPVPERAPGAIEAPFLIERQGYYYLFVSFDYCCRGAASSYYQVVGRAREVQGPYLGRDGRPMLQGYGTLLLQGHGTYRGPGHAAVLRDVQQDYLVYHAYDAKHDGKPTLRIAPILWSRDGWPNVAA